VSAPRSLWFEDFEPGQRYPTRERRITDADHEAFCRLVGYEVPIFLDDAYAKSRGMPGRICPSHLVMSFSTAIVRPGDSLRTEVEVVEKRISSKPDRGVVVFRDHVYNQDSAEVFRNDKIALIRRRAPAP